MIGKGSVLEMFRRRMNLCDLRVLRLLVPETVVSGLIRAVEDLLLVFARVELE